MKQIGLLYGEHKYREAWLLACQSEQELRRVARLTGEAQMAKDADLMREYQGTLARWVERETGRPPALAADEGEEQPGRLYRGAELTPDVPAIEIQ